MLIRCHLSVVSLHILIPVLIGTRKGRKTSLLFSAKLGKILLPNRVPVGLTQVVHSGVKELKWCSRLRITNSLSLRPTDLLTILPKISPKEPDNNKEIQGIALKQSCQHSSDSLKYFQTIKLKCKGSELSKCQILLNSALIIIIDNW